MWMSAAERESEALATLAARRGRLRNNVLLAFLLAGIVAGAFGYLAMRELQFASTGVHIAYLSGIIGFGGPFLLAAELGRRVALAMVHARTGGWVADLAQEHGVDREELMRTAAMVRGIEA
jgi:hypothetical protein